MSTHGNNEQHRSTDKIPTHTLLDLKARAPSVRMGPAASDKEDRRPVSARFRRAEAPARPGEGRFRRPRLGEEPFHGYSIALFPDSRASRARANCSGQRHGYKSSGRGSAVQSFAQEEEAAGAAAVVRRALGKEERDQHKAHVTRQNAHTSSQRHHDEPLARSPAAPRPARAPPVQARHRHLPSASLLRPESQHGRLGRPGSVARRGGAPEPSPDDEPDRQGPACRHAGAGSLQPATHQQGQPNLSDTPGGFVATTIAPMYPLQVRLSARRSRIDARRCAFVQTYIGSSTYKGLPTKGASGARSSTARGNPALSR